MEGTVCSFEGVSKKRILMREWLSGGVSPCQGEGRGFESRLALVNLRNLLYFII